MKAQTGNMLGAVGALALIVGPFLPVYFVPFKGAINLTSLVDWDAAVLVGCGVFALLVATDRKLVRLLILPALIALWLSLSQVSQLMEVAAEINAKAGGAQILLGKVLGGGYADLMWGWVVIFGGIALLVIAAFMAEKPQEASHLDQQDDGLTSDQPTRTIDSALKPTLLLLSMLVVIAIIVVNVDTIQPSGSSKEPTALPSTATEQAPRTKPNPASKWTSDKLLDDDGAVSAKVAQTISTDGKCVLTITAKADGNHFGSLDCELDFHPVDFIRFKFDRDTSIGSLRASISENGNGFLIQGQGTGEESRKDFEKWLRLVSLGNSLRFFLQDKFLKPVQIDFSLAGSAAALKRVGAIIAL